MQQNSINEDLYNYVQKLEIGQEVKNYKYLCDLLNQPVQQGGNQKQAHMKELQRYFQFKKSGQKFIITEIYETPMEKEDKRSLGNNRERYKIKS